MPITKTRSNGFFDGQPKFDFPKPDFGESDLDKSYNWDNDYNGITNNVDKSIK